MFLRYFYRLIGDVGPIRGVHVWGQGMSMPIPTLDWIDAYSNVGLRVKAFYA